MEWDCAIMTNETSLEKSNLNDFEYGKSDDFQSLFCAKCEKDLEVWLDQDVFGMIALCNKCISEEFPEEFDNK